MRFSVLSFGCRANQAESCQIERDLRAGGGVPAASDSADVVVVNTCSVTAAADAASRRGIRSVARANPRAQIVATGCYATRKPDDVARLPGVTRLVPNARKPQIAEIITPAVISGRSDGDLTPGVISGRRSPGNHSRSDFCRVAPRGQGPDRVPAQRADRVRRAVRLLHRAEHARAGAQPRRGAGRG